MRIRTGPQKISVEACFFPDRTGLLSAIAERDRDRIVRVPGRNESRDDQFSPNRLLVRVLGHFRHGDVDEIAVGDAKVFGENRAH